MKTFVCASVGKTKNWQLTYFGTFIFKTCNDNSDIIWLTLL
jgi:hypothetical protein